MTRSGWSSMIRSPGVWCGGAMVLVIVAGVALAICHWSWLHSNETSPSATIRNIGLVIGGVVAGLLAAWRIAVVNHQAASARRGVVDEQYRHGAEMLGSDNLPIRLAGIHVLGRLAREYPAETHVAVMTTLCAFVRYPVGKGMPAGPFPDRLPREPKDPITRRRPKQVREDVQAIMNVMRDRSEQQVMLERRADFRLDFQGASLRRAMLRSIDLDRAVFHLADLSHAMMKGTSLVEADLCGANLTGAEMILVDLTEADITGARIARAMFGANKGLVQEQLYLAVENPPAPPDPREAPLLRGAFDAETEQQLVWPRGGVDQAAR